jgi:hypothetical protein
MFEEEEVRYFEVLERSSDCRAVGSAVAFVEGREEAAGAVPVAIEEFDSADNSIGSQIAGMVGFEEH